MGCRWGSIFSCHFDLSDHELVKNKYFKEISHNSTEAYRESLNNVFKKKLFEDVQIMKVNGGPRIQEIKESSKFKIIPYISSDQVGYYCSKQDYGSVESLHYRYLGGNFETHYLQANKYYDSGKEGVFRENSFMKIVAKWYFKIGFPLFFILLLSSLFKTRQKCPECGSKDFYQKHQDIDSEYYKHEKKNGERDLRNKDNPLVRVLRLTMECNKCSHTWVKIETIISASGEKTLKKPISNRKSGKKNKRSASNPEITAD